MPHSIFPTAAGRGEGEAELRVFGDWFLVEWGLGIGFWLSGDWFLKMVGLVRRTRRRVFSGVLLRLAGYGAIFKRCESIKVGKFLFRVVLPCGLPVVSKRLLSNGMLYTKARRSTGGSRIQIFAIGNRFNRARQGFHGWHGAAGWRKILDGQ